MLLCQANLTPDAEQVAKWWATEPHFVMAILGVVVLAAVTAYMFRLLMAALDKSIDREKVVTETLKDNCHVLETISGKTDENAGRITNEVKSEAERTRSAIIPRIDALARKDSS